MDSVALTSTVASVPTVASGAFDQIMAIDLGKFKSVVCLMDVTSRKHTFVTLDQTSPQSLHEFLSFHAGVNAAPTA